MKYAMVRIGEGERPQIEYSCFMDSLYILRAVSANCPAMSRKAPKKIPKISQKPAKNVRRSCQKYHKKLPKITQKAPTNIPERAQEIPKIINFKVFIGRGWNSKRTMHIKIVIGIYPNSPSDS